MYLDKLQLHFEKLTKCNHPRSGYNNNVVAQAELWAVIEPRTACHRTVRSCQETLNSEICD